MLFNSFAFILVYLPIVLLVFYGFSGRLGQRFGVWWLILASLFFYGWWNYRYLVLLVLSIVANYAIGRVLANHNRKLFLIAGLLFNLGLLGYYKYANFLVDNLNAAFGVHLQLDSIILPLAISFFTFQQITYLVDCYRGEVKAYDLAEYFCFVSFFPQLIAGPIVHHGEMVKQFQEKTLSVFRHGNLARGITWFSLGLWKKVVLADNISVYAQPVFDAAEKGIHLSFFEAWGGALAYTFQLYFDFSGYTDMAIGLAMMFGISLPINFNSPYKSKNIVEFWRRWHITLSRFLLQYVYITLGGNRLGEWRRHCNIIVTMVLGGIWHGAGWTFLLWGALHAAYQCLPYLAELLQVV